LIRFICSPITLIDLIVGPNNVKSPKISELARTLPWLALALGLALAPAALAQQPTPSDDEVNAIAKKLFCPVCENVPLDVCPTVACAQWRATIREQLAAGRSEQQILDYFVQQYGERVLAQPSTRGLNVLVWALPPLILLAGAALYVVFVRRMVARGPAEPPAPASPGTDEYVARLERELEERR
jgi:cytochrome c-type biogenesis protein CcmH